MLKGLSQWLCRQSVAVTEKYNAPRMPSRKLRRERLLFESLVDTKSNRLRDGEGNVGPFTDEHAAALQLDAGAGSNAGAVVKQGHNREPDIGQVGLTCLF